MQPRHNTLRNHVFLSGLAVAAITLMLAASPAGADPLLFNALAGISFVEEAGGTYYYDLSLSSHEQPFYEVYLVLDPEKVVSGATGAVGPDAAFVSAELLSHPSIELYFSADHRSLANIDNPRLLDRNLMDTYDPLLTDPLPADCYSLAMRLGLNRELSPYEMYQLGYWAGDLRGMLDETMPFTESDGNPVPEPATLLLAVGGLAGLYGARRKRR